jgi:Zn-dependent protease with chaperone function
MFRRFFLKALVAFPVVSLVGCRFSPSSALDAGSGLYTAASVTDEEIRETSRRAAAQSDAANKVAPADSKYAKRLNKLTAGLENVDGLQFNFKVYNTPEINACAFGDGSLRFFTGLMDLMDDDELFFIIGHEIGHVVNGDSADKMRVAMVAAAARSGASAAGGVAAAISASELGDLSEAFINAQFSQSQERDADDYGLKLMQKYNRNPMAAATSLLKLDSPGRDPSLASRMLASHPEPKARAERIQKQLKA